MMVIPNGIDTKRFSPNPAARMRVRGEWDIGEREILIGMTARLDCMKDHGTFLRAAALIVRRRNDIRFACVGEGLPACRRELRQLADRLGIGARLIWPEARADIEVIYSAFDISVSSSSFGEGFSNAVAEAMACGTPCVVTDVGDSAEIVGNRTLVVPPRDPERLAEKLLELAQSSDRGALGRSARERIEHRFGLDKMVRHTAAAIENLRPRTARWRKVTGE
jgi:glycosyltransferase involved in cell wall biosynthesis